MALPKQVVDVLNAARHWAHARAQILQVTDRKSATPEDLKKAQKALFDASDALFKAVAQFEKFLRMRPAGKKNSINWAALFGAVAKGAGILEGIVKASNEPGRRMPPIVDTVGEEVG